MKELQNFVYRHMDALKHHKRYLAMLTALSMLVTFIVPLILVEPADSMTGILVCNKTVHTHNAECYVGDTLICDIEEHIHTGACYKKISTVSLKGEGNTNETITVHNVAVPNAGGGYNEDTGSYDSGDGNEVDDVTYNPATLPLYTLLFGTGDDHWVDTSKSLEENLEIVDDEYFLGFASDFCAFIESDFTAFDADAEGRMFVGGDLIFKGGPAGEWNYQVGAGDYGHSIPIWETDEYSGITEFASGIVGGKVYRLATMSTLATLSQQYYPRPLPSNREDRHSKDNDIFVYPEEGAYKRFVIGNIKDSLHLDEDYLTMGDGVSKDVSYSTSCNHLYHNSNCAICSSKTDHNYLGDVNELSQFYIYDDVSTILERTFDTLRARSLSLSSVKAIDGVIDNKDNKGILILDASDVGDAKTAYFNVNDWKTKDAEGKDVVIKNVQIIVPPDRVEYAENGENGSEFALNKKTIGNLDLNIIISCDDSSIEIPQSVNTYIKVGHDGETPDEGLGYRISNRGLSDVAMSNTTNNHPISSNILYNFYNAKLVEFLGEQGGSGANFNGTIMAPNAHVKTKERCPGHLSGALIAKSFYGGLEFGYRPYRGGVDIFGMASGYAIPVNKFGDDGETALPGALFAIKQDGKFVSLFESGEGTNFAALPSKVDFSGKTAYEQDEITQDTTASRNYAGNTVIGEKLTAPVDFKLYTNSDCTSEIQDNLDGLTVFYLKANQRVNLESNENFVYTYDNNTDIYTIYPIKLVDSFTITAKNAADNTSEKTATVNFNTKTAAMELTVDKDVVTLNDVESDEISLGVTNPPTGNTIYYKFFANGNVIKVNDNTQDNGYTTDNSGKYTPNVAGGLELSVKAYVKVGEEYYEVESAIAPKVTVKQADLAIKLYKVENDNDKIDLTNNTLISGETLNIVVEGVPNGATIQYEFYNKHANTNNKSQTFDTNGIVGKNLTVKAIIDGTTTLEDTVTVDFPDMTLNLLSTNYVVGHSGISFNLNNIPQGAALRCVVDGNSTEYTKGYCNSNEEWYISPKVVRTDIPVDVYVEMNGLTKKFTKYINGTYHENLGMSISQGPYTVGSDITLSLDYAPNGAKVEFKAYDSNNNEVLSTTSDVNNGVATAKFTPNKADKYTFKAFMTYESNPKLEFKIENIDVVAKPVYGELSVNPNVVNTGNKVYFKLYNATSDANVSFVIRKKNESDNNDSYIDIATINGTQGNSGEYTAEYTPSQAGTYNVKAIISKDGATNSYNTDFTVNENTSTLDGDLTLDPSDETVKPNTQITVNVSNATNGAVLKLNITGPGISEEKTETISDDTYTYSFTAEKVGTYTVTGTLTSGTQTHSLGERKVTVMDEITIKTIDGADENGQFKIGERVTLGLSSLPAGTDHVDYYLLSLDANNVMQNRTELEASYDGKTITFTPGQTGEHEYRANAIDSSGNVIATVTQKFTTIMPQYTIDIKADKEVYTGGEKVTITIDGLPTGNSKFVINNIQCSLDGYGGMTLTKDSENTYSFTAPNYNLSNEKRNLQITFNYNNGVSLSDTIQIIICEDPNVVNVTSNENPNIVSLAFKKYLNILEDENTGTDLTDNCIIIDSQDGTFKSVSLVLPSDYNSETASFTLKATFKAANGDTIGEDKTYSKGDVVNGKIDITGIPANTATIEITPVAGSVTIANCNPTFTKTETRIEQKYAQGFTLKKNEEKEIVLKDWVISGTLDSITFNLDEAGTICYALISGNETIAPVFKEAKLENKTAKIEGINAEGIEKIKIYTTDESLTINDYTISAFVGSSEYSESELKALRTQTQDIINVYTLVEQQAPVGYFKEEKVYIVEVKESIKFYETAEKSPYPRDVLTTVTVKETNGTEVLSYAVDVDYSSSNGTEQKIITIVDNDENPDNDVKFTLRKGEDGNLTVDRTDASVDVSQWNTATKPVSNNGYYFDPEAMMVVPVSNEPIEYTNKMGLLFRKIDTMGAAVDGVEIKLYKLINAETKLYEEAGSDMWYWDENSKDYLIDFEKLTIGAVYKIKETYAGGKYELADEIYLKRTDDREVIYWLGSDEMPSDATTENQRTVLDFGANLETRVIRMKNTRIPGVKITLKKTDMEDKVLGGETDFAKFCLYAYDGTEILHEIEVKNGQVELDFSNFKGEEKYVSDGYLMPGTYYFKEIKAPDQYEASMKNFYFNVVKTNDGAFNIVASELLPDVLLLEEVQSDGSSNKVIRFRPEALKRVSDGITAETINADTPIIQFKFKTDNGEIGSGNGEGYANAKFTAVINGREIRYNSSKLPSGCINHNNGNGIFFRNETVTVQFTVRQLCELFNVSVENFNTIKEFVITSWNSTVVEDLEFLEIENPITGGGSSGGSGSGNEIYTTTKSYYDSGQQKDEAFNVTVVSQGALNRITDNMITSDTTVLKFDVYTSAENQVSQHWGNYRFIGTYNGTETVRDKIQVEQERKTFTLNAKGMLEQLGINPANNSTELIEQFRKLTSFEIGTVAANATVVENLEFYGVSNETESDNENDTGETPEETVAIPMLSVDRNTIAIPNAPVGNKMNLRVEKRWRGDDGIPELRQPVEVQLMQKQVGGENAFDYKAFNPTTDENNQPTGGTVILNEANDWSYIWENLPRFVDDDEAKGKYYYTIKEITAVKGYEKPEVSGGDINAGGTVVIINKAKTVDIPAEKIWSNETKYTPVYPRTVKFKLQAKVSDAPEEWKDIPGKTLTITGTGNNKTWSGKFTGLIEGYQYKVVEVDVPYGWTPGYDNATVEVPENDTESFTGKFEVTNQYAIDEGSIALAKLWEGENAARPYEIYLDLYRSVVAPSYTKTDAPYTDNNASKADNEKTDYKDDYMRLLQHSLYFYDANMCGTDVSTSSDLAWRTNCHTEDEILGGYHDAGDHVMFGLPQGYTASMLSWMYLEFFKGNVTNNNGNVKYNNTYMMNHYEDDHFKVILERFYDFFANSVEYGDDGKIKKLLLQKGQGNIDHLIWCAPEIQKNRENEMIWSETQGSNIAAEYAAALALGYLNFYDSNSTDEDEEEKEKYENYLKIAEDLYEFSGRTTSFIASDSEGTYYKETDEPNPASDDRAWAAAWLYQATKDRDGEENTGYKDARSNSPNQLQWDDVSFSAACAYASQTGNWTNVINKIDSEFINNSDAKKKDFYYIHPWGTARFNAMAQTAVLITAKHLYETPEATHKYSNNTEISYNDIANSYVTWAEGQMDKILGNNTWKDTISTNGCVGGTVEDTNLPICLVTNFVPDGFDVDTPQNPHHRAASGLDSVNGDSNLEYKDSCVYDDDSYTLVGALVGGPAFGAHSDQAQMIGYDHKHPLTTHDYIDDLHDYCCNEVAIDYNAGLVGAAAGLYYFNGTGARSTMIEGVEFGSYGLKTIEGDIASPTKSAIPEVTQDYNVDPANDVAGAVLKTFAMRQTAISVMADSTSENYCILEEGDKNHTFTNNGGDEKIYDEDIYENVTKIEIDLDCSNSYVDVWTDGIGGIQFEYTEMDESGNTKVVDTGWLENKDGQNPISTLRSISFTSPKKITKLRFHNVKWWTGGNNVIIEEIRVYGTRVMSIAGESKVTVGSEIELDVKSAPDDAYFRWISSNENIATVDTLGKVTPKKSGELEITLEAYDNEDLSGDPIATASKSITVVESVTVTEGLGTLSKGNNKDFKLSNYLPSGAILKSVSINVSPEDSNAINDFGGGLMVGDEETKNPWNQQNFNVNLNPEGQTFTLEGEYMNGVDCSIHKFTLGLWGADGTVNINSLTFEYIMDSTFIEIYYTDENERDSKIIRNGESVEFEVKATGGTIGGVQLKNGETVIETYEVINDETFSLTISPEPGEYTIVAAMGGDNSSKTDSIALTVKDKITINGSEIMDLNGSQKLSVSNAIEGIEWSVTADENYTVEDGDVVVTIKESENIIATFNKSTGDVTTFEYDGEFTLTVKDNYNSDDEGSTDSITISITERPKLPELPKEIFRELYIKGNSETIKLSAEDNWYLKLADLPTHDEKGNPYYYYIQESGYRQTKGGEYKPLTDQTGHFIYSTNASYMPSAYYNNGVAPDKDNAPDIVAKVGNKLHSKMQGQLPSTGGSGVTTYYYLGGVIMLLSIAGFTGLKRRERKRRKEE